MAKKRTAAQKRATRRLVLRNKSKKSGSKSSNRRKNKTNTMKRSSSRRRSVSRGFGRVGSSLKSGIIGEAIKGAGAAQLSHLFADRVAPQYSSIIGVGAGFAAGGVVGGIAAAFTEGLIGSGLFGGMNRTAQTTSMGASQ
jgi:hypothetical protein